MRGPVVFLVAASILLVSGTARAPLSNSMEPPAWSDGDLWVYRFNSTFEGTVFLNGTVRAEILQVENRTVRGVPQDVFVVATGGSGTLAGPFRTLNVSFPATGSWNLTGEQLFTTTSRKVVKNLIDITASGQVGILDVPFTLLWTNSTSSRVVRDDWRYPVPTNFTGAVALNTSIAENVIFRFDNVSRTVNASLEAEVSYSATLAAKSMATVPAGTFETFVIRESWPDGSEERFDYAPAAGNNARTQTFNSTGSEVSRTELVSFRYRAGDPPAGFPVIVAGVAIAIVAAVVVLSIWLLARRRTREREFTPPSLREPPTSGP